jgi:hypothetical protein
VLTDPFFRRLERTAVAVCLGMAAIAFLWSGGRPGAAVAVLAGGLLIGLSYWTIGLGVQALTIGMTVPPTAAGEPLQSPVETAPNRPPRARGTMLRVTLRYALLALLAYVMIARLRLHPLGLLAGASSVVAAASIEACRLLLKKS